MTKPENRQQTTIPLNSQTLIERDTWNTSPEVVEGRNAWGEIPATTPSTTFNRADTGRPEMPAEILGWRYSVTFGRWSALVRFTDGYECFTYPNVWPFVPWVREVAEALKAAGYRIITIITSSSVGVAREGATASDVRAAIPRTCRDFLTVETITPGRFTVQQRTEEAIPACAVCRLPEAAHDGTEAHRFQPSHIPARGDRS